MNEDQDTVLMRVYMTDKPRVLGLFHFGHAVAAGPAAKKKHWGGLIMHAGPCKCGDPTHKYPTYYSMTPCLFINVLGEFVSMRIPWLVFDALQWFAGPL